MRTHQCKLLLEQLVQERYSDMNDERLGAHIVSRGQNVLIQSQALPPLGSRAYRDMAVLCFAIILCHNNLSQTLFQASSGSALPVGFSASGTRSTTRK